MHINTGSRFTSFVFTDDERKISTQVSPYFLAHLQNKIAAYASSAVDFEFDMTDPHKAATEHAVIRGQVAVLEELMQELQDSQPAESSN